MIDFLLFDKDLLLINFFNKDNTFLKSHKYCKKGCQFLSKLSDEFDTYFEKASDYKALMVPSQEIMEDLKKVIK